MFGHGAYGSNKYGGIVKEGVFTITYRAKIPSILSTLQEDKNMLQSSQEDKHVLKSNNNKIIL